MAEAGRGRPEGARTGSRVATFWYLVREILFLFALWIAALYMLTRSRGDVGSASIVLVVGALVALIGGFAIECMVMRKSPTLWGGCLLLAVWIAAVPYVEPGGWLAAPGIVGLLMVALTPRVWRERDARRQRDFLTAHERYRPWRRRLQRTLVAGVWVGAATAAFSGIMDAMPRF